MPEHGRDTLLRSNDKQLCRLQHSKCSNTRRWLWPPLARTGLHPPRCCASSGPTAAGTVFNSIKCINLTLRRWQPVVARCCTLLLPCLQVLSLLPPCLAISVRTPGSQQAPLHVPALFRAAQLRCQLVAPVRLHHGVRSGAAAKHMQEQSSTSTRHATIDGCVGCSLLNC